MARPSGGRVVRASVWRAVSPWRRGGRVSDGRCICISISSIATENQKLARMSEIFGRP
jgi:hypothetical protein